MSSREETSLRELFNPRSVAIIGASRKEGKIGHSIVKNIVDSGYEGEVYPVNPGEREILARPCYPGVGEIPAPVEVAVIAIPAPAVLEAARQCGRKGVRYLVVISAGFKEVGRKGLELERELAAVCRGYGMRLVGPNSLGLMDTHTPINASFSAVSPLKGEIGFFSQSGALCASILDWSLTRGIGFSKFVSMGNKADLNEVDFIEDAAADPYTRVILCYIEGVSDGPRFVRVAREASRRKPIVIIKSGVSQAGARAASSHTGALAGSDLAYETAFRQCGVFRARGMEELFDLAIAFASQPPPRGDRVAVVTNSGGPGILATDGVELRGLEMARLDRSTTDELRRRLPLEASVYNPVDVLGDAGTDRYRLALELVVNDPGVDSVVVLLTPTATTRPAEVAGVMVEVNREHPGKPVVAAFMGGASVEAGAKLLMDNAIPCYLSPERAVIALAGLSRYARFLRRPVREGTPAFPDLDRRAVEEVLAGARRENRRVLLGSEGSRIAAAYGIPAAPSYLATSPREAGSLASRAGFPVAMKVASPQVLHKTDVGGVRLQVSSEDEAEKAFIDILESVQRFLPDARIYGVEVQPMMPRGTELIIGVSRDVQFGPLVMFGLGGIYVNLLRDVAFRLAEGLSREEIREMIAETKAYTLLKGFRGERPGDLGAVVEAVARVARLATDFPELVELDLNPVFAYEKGITALDVKITIGEVLER